MQIPNKCSVNHIYAYRHNMQKRKRLYPEKWVKQSTACYNSVNTQHIVHKVFTKIDIMKNRSIV
jgi:hypothetical protein